MLCNHRGGRGSLKGLCMIMGEGEGEGEGVGLVMT